MCNSDIEIIITADDKKKAEISGELAYSYGHQIASEGNGVLNNTEIQRGLAVFTVVPQEEISNQSIEETFQQLYKMASKTLILTNTSNLHANYNADSRTFTIRAVIEQ